MSEAETGEVEAEDMAVRVRDREVEAEDGQYPPDLGLTASVRRVTPDLTSAFGLDSVRFS